MGWKLFSYLDLLTKLMFKMSKTLTGLITAKLMKRIG